MTAAKTRSLRNIENIRNAKTKRKESDRINEINETLVFAATPLRRRVTITEEREGIKRRNQRSDARQHLTRMLPSCRLAVLTQ
jgi:hypothetical protein